MVTERDTFIYRYLGESLDDSCYPGMWTEDAQRQKGRDAHGIIWKMVKAQVATVELTLARWYCPTTQPPWIGQRKGAASYPCAWGTMPCEE